MYRDDGLGIYIGILREVEKMKKDVCKIFYDNDLRVIIEVNKKVVNFFDVILNLNLG